MHRLRSALLLGGAVLLTSYISAPAAPTPLPARASDAEIHAIDASTPLIADVAQETERLRARLAVVPEQSVPRRDPFTFGSSSRAKGRPAKASEPDSAAPEVEAPPAIAWPTLVALLTDKGVAGTTTAVLAVGDAVEMLKAGETAGGFMVREITSTSIEVVHVATSSVTWLTLR